MLLISDLEIDRVLVCKLKMKRLFSRIEDLMAKSRGCVCDVVGSASRILLMVLNNAVWSLFMCVLALGMLVSFHIHQNLLFELFHS